MKNILGFGSFLCIALLLLSASMTCSRKVNGDDVKTGGNGVQAAETRNDEKSIALKESDLKQADYEPGPEFPVYPIALVPAHGGKRAEASKTNGDKWDPDKGKFLSKYNDGAHYKELDYFEARWSLEVLKKARDILGLIQSPGGWEQFKDILRRYAREPGQGFKRIGFRVFMTNEDTFLDRPPEPNINKYYRLYDSPESFGPGSKPSEAMYPGIFTRINRFAPELVVTVHIDNRDVPDPSLRGMGAVITPGYDFFAGAKKFYEAGDMTGLGKMVPNRYRTGRWKSLSNLVNDAFTYFSGFQPNGGYFGVRSEFFQWAYKEDKLITEKDLTPLSKDKKIIPLSPAMKFWAREQNPLEIRRRSGGGEGMGGDNFYASEEIIRFARFALAADAAGKISPGDMKKYIGPHNDPYLSDFALPIFSNAVVAYMESGYLFQDKDRELLYNKRDRIAEALAVAIYSLYVGIEPLEMNLVTAPKGTPVDFDIYRREDYFNDSKP